MEVSIAPAQACFWSGIVSLQTRHAREFVDITESIEECIAQSGVRDGLVVAASQHTTASIVVNEHEPELLKDLNGFLQRLAPEHREYAHNDAPCGPGEMPNGHSHCQALLLNTTASVPIIGGRMAIGRYQRVFLVELDHPRPRRVTVAVLGS
ncbi:MAG TPA: secondary thiamine-phosphate synthase enzyme YjbQ [Chloroflexota bacterium]|nr:secondary thiamine-phosphate synthase enzyme YjbQ [Chloroflexota bacterium]